MGKLSTGAFFGERALLENKPRAASIRCLELARTMAISRPQLELKLGATLRDLLSSLQDRADGGGGVIGEGQFCELARILGSGSAWPKARLREAFRKLDWEGSGKVHLIECERVFLKANAGSNESEGTAAVEIDLGGFIYLVRLYEKQYRGSDKDLLLSFDALDMHSKGKISWKQFLSFRQSLEDERRRQQVDHLKMN